MQRKEKYLEIFHFLREIQESFHARASILQVFLSSIKQKPFKYLKKTKKITKDIV